MKEGNFPRLFGQGNIGRVRFRNRLVMLPMGTAYGTAQGEVSQRTIDYYVERAKGGVGMITVGNISPYYLNNPNQLLLNSDSPLLGHYELVEQVHRYGAKITAQINYSGKQKHPNPGSDEELVSSSAIPTTFLGEVFPTPRALTEKEIYQFVERYALAAARAKSVGYDMVEIHGSHGYLITQFMSPFFNKRTDKFGGSLENRMRFPLELVRAVRQAVGPGFPVGFRMSAVEFVPGGITLDESTIIAQLIEAEGVAYLSVSAGVYESAEKFSATMSGVEGWKEYIWKAIKKVVKVPVIGGGELRHPEFCERLLVEGTVDFVGLARPMFADPHWCNKVKEGRFDEVRMCISCNECYSGSAARRRGGGARRCTVNPVTGREGDFGRLIPAEKLKRVFVIGGGPAGMEAAQIAAKRGHKVTLYERGPELGGQLLLAARPQAKKKLLWVRDYLVNQLKRLDIKVELGVNVTPALIGRLKPDAVVIATGAEPLVLAIPGRDGGNVISSWDLLASKVTPHGEKVGVLGGGLVGCEVATYLIEQGNQVIIVEQLNAIGADMEPFHRVEALGIFTEKKAGMLTNRRAVGIDPRGIRVKNMKTGQEELIEVDRVIVAVGSKPVDSLVTALEGKVPELYTAGDCNCPRVVMEALYEGTLAGRQV